MSAEANAAQACLILHKKSANRPEVRQAIDHCRECGVDLTVRIPFQKKDTKEFVDQALSLGVTRIIAGGGDGTLNKVANILMKKGRRNSASLGIMPLGTANDFAFGAGLPKDDLSACLMRAATGETTLIDIGQANKRYFVNVASGGFGAEVTATTPQGLKAALGGAAYTLTGMARALNLKPYNCRFTDPGGATLETPVIALAVGNNRYAGGGFEVAPKAQLQDGLLDISILTTESLQDPAIIAAELANPFGEDNKLLRYHQAKSFSIEADRPLHINLDGEAVVDTRFDFDTHKQALSVVLGDR